jgi:hypothetical protein
MVEDCPIAPFARRKSAEKIEDAAPEVKRQGENCPELDDDAVHFPEAVREVDPEERFGNPEMRR